MNQPPSDTGLGASADQQQQIRFFRAGSGRVRGHTGNGDLEEFAEILEVLQDASVRIGNELEMDAVSHCVVYEEGSTCAYRYDPDSDPRQPTVVGALVNRQVPVRELMAKMSEH